MNNVEYVKSLPLTEALFWYIENIPRDAPGNADVFFALRERYRDEYQSGVATQVVFPTMLRKMWSGGEVQRWMDGNVAPALHSRDAALRRILNLLGPVKAPTCSGCEWEWRAALRTAREALGIKEPTDEAPTETASDS